MLKIMPNLKDAVQIVNFLYFHLSGNPSKNNNLSLYLDNILHEGNLYLSYPVYEGN